MQAWAHFFFGTKWDGFKDYCFILIILFNITHVFAHSYIVPHIIMYHKQFN